MVSVDCVVTLDILTANWSSWDVPLHFHHADSHDKGDSKNDIKDDGLVFEPVVDVNVFISKKSGILSSQKDENPNHNSSSEEIVKLKEESESTLLSFEVYSVEFDQFINGMESIEDEECPVDDVVGLGHAYIWVVSNILHYIEFVFLGHDGHDSSKNDWDCFITKVEAIITTSIHPELRESSEGVHNLKI